METLDYSRVSSYNNCVCALFGNILSNWKRYKFIYKGYDEDSKILLKFTANRRWCESGMSKIFLNITSELQSLKILSKG